MKKISIIFLVIGVIVISGYIYIRKSVTATNFQPAAPQDKKTETKPAETALDLRPLFIKKLQELVKEGSGGLYNLSIHEVAPDVLNSSIVVKEAEMVPDTAVLMQLKKANKAPASVYKVKLSSLTIDGLGLKDILNKKVIDLKTIHIKDPEIELFSSNKNDNEKESKETLYQRLKDKLEHLGIDKIIIEGGKLVHHDLEKNKTSKLNQIAIQLSNVLIDSTTQYDKKRFFFARQAVLSLKDYSMPTSDGLYDLHIADITAVATQSTVTAKNMILMPRFSKKEFGEKTKVMQERYELTIPSIRFKNMDWWDLANKEKIIASEANINDARFNIYLNRSLPQGKIRLNTFPSQLIMKLPTELNIGLLRCNNLQLVYEEFNPFSGQTGKLIVDHLQGVVKNVTNMPAAIKKNHYTTINASGMLLNKVTALLAIRFDLNRYKTGDFNATVSTGSFDGAVINPVTTPLGLFKIKSGSVDSLTVHEEGNNTKASGKMLLLYKDLKIDPLEKDKNNDGGLNKRHFSGFVANTFIIKHQNPTGNEPPRSTNGSFNRDPHGSFFNLIWKTALVNILETVGAPKKLADPKPYHGN